jgi:chromosome segregation ATPase
MGESIGYIYVYLRGRLDAEDRRRRLTEERAGAEAMLSGAYNELALTVMREGVTHGDLTGLLEAVGRAQARQEAAAADMAAGDALQQAEATRLAAQETAAEKQWSAADGAAKESDDILRATNADRRAVESRLGKVKDERARLDRETGGSPLGPARNAEIAHESAGLAAEQASLEERMSSLDAQIADLRAKAAGARSAAAASKSALDQAVAARRQAASAMAASIAGRQRDRAEAEREVADLTGQLGRAAAQARPPHATLLSTYQNIDRLSEMISERSAQLALLAETSGRYDQRKLLTGVGLVTTMLVASAALLWMVLK